MVTPNWSDELPEDLRKLVEQLHGLPDFPVRLARFAHALSEQHRRKGGKYAELARRAFGLAPDDDAVRVASEWAVRSLVPRWHFPLVHDAERNAVLDEAIRRHVGAETTVLEIGAGSGLVALMAARAGARHVYACESQPILADAARKNAASNGLADRVTVIAKPSTQLELGKDLPVLVDLVICEIFGSDLLGSRLLPTIEDAKHRLLSPDGCVLPKVVALRGMLVGGSTFARACRAGTSMGFELSGMDNLAPTSVGLAGTGVALEDTLSDEVELMRFDLDACERFPSSESRLRLRATRAGRAEGLLAWMLVDYGDGTCLERRPPQALGVWCPRLHVFPHSLEVRAGDDIPIWASHDRAAVVFRPD